MKDILLIIFDNFWSFIGSLLLLSIILYVPFYFISNVINRIIRRNNIKQHGYPPSYCDADGDIIE